MSAHQHDPNANELWSYFQAAIHWVELTFTTYRKEMKGVDWGGLYNQFKDGLYDTAELEDEIKALMIDDDVTRKKGIYSYVLTRDEKYLAIRAFTEAQRRGAYERQRGICPRCGQHFEIGGMEADHITPWSQGGKTNADNCQMLCLEDNRRKGAI
jgi:HNH endonuclease